MRVRFLLADRRKVKPFANVPGVRSLGNELRAEFLDEGKHLFPDGVDEHHFSARSLHSRVQWALPSSGGPAWECLCARSSKDLDLIFALQFERTVNRDNTVSVQNLRLQIEPVRWRATLAGCTVTVHQHLDGTFTITHGPQRLGHYSAEGGPLQQEKLGGRGAVEKTQSGKVQKPTFPLCLEIPQTPRDSHFPTASAAGH